MAPPRDHALDIHSAYDLGPAPSADVGANLALWEDEGGEITQFRSVLYVWIPAAPLIPDAASRGGRSRRAHAPAEPGGSLSATDRARLGRRGVAETPTPTLSEGLLLLLRSDGRHGKEAGEDEADDRDRVTEARNGPETGRAADGDRGLAGRRARPPQRRLGGHEVRDDGRQTHAVQETERGGGGGRVRSDGSSPLALRTASPNSFQPASDEAACRPGAGGGGDVDETKNSLRRPVALTGGGGRGRMVDTDSPLLAVCLRPPPPPLADAGVVGTSGTRRVAEWPAPSPTSIPADTTAITPSASATTTTAAAMAESADSVSTTTAAAPPPPPPPPPEAPLPTSSQLLQQRGRGGRRSGSTDGALTGDPPGPAPVPSLLLQRRTPSPRDAASRGSGESPNPPSIPGCAHRNPSREKPVAVGPLPPSRAGTGPRCSDCSAADAANNNIVIACDDVINGDDILSTGTASSFAGDDVFSVNISGLNRSCTDRAETEQAAAHKEEGREKVPPACACGLYNSPSTSRVETGEAQKEEREKLFPPRACEAYNCPSSSQVEEGVAGLEDGRGSLPPSCACAVYNRPSPSQAQGYHHCSRRVPWSQAAVSSTGSSSSPSGQRRHATGPVSIDTSNRTAAGHCYYNHHHNNINNSSTGTCYYNHYRSGGVSDGRVGALSNGTAVATIASRCVVVVSALIKYVGRNAVLPHYERPGQPEHTKTAAARKKPVPVCRSLVTTTTTTVAGAAASSGSSPLTPPACTSSSTGSPSTKTAVVSNVSHCSLTVLQESGDNSCDSLHHPGSSISSSSESPLCATSSAFTAAAVPTSPAFVESNCRKRTHCCRVHATVEDDGGGDSDTGGDGVGGCCCCSEEIRAAFARPGSRFQCVVVKQGNVDLSVVGSPGRRTYQSPPLPSSGPNLADSPSSSYSSKSSHPEAGLSRFGRRPAPAEPGTVSGSAVAVESRSGLTAATAAAAADAACFGTAATGSAVNAAPLSVCVVGASAFFCGESSASAASSRADSAAVSASVTSEGIGLVPVTAAAAVTAVTAVSATSVSASSLLSPAAVTGARPLPPATDPNRCVADSNSEITKPPTSDSHAGSVPNPSRPSPSVCYRGNNETLTPKLGIPTTTSISEAESASLPTSAVTLTFTPTFPPTTATLISALTMLVTGVTESVAVVTLPNVAERRVESAVHFRDGRRHKSTVHFQPALAPVRFADTLVLYGKNTTRRRFVSRTFYEPRVRPRRFAETDFVLPKEVTPRFASFLDYRVDECRKWFKTCLQLTARTFTTVHHHPQPGTAAAASTTTTTTTSKSHRRPDDQVNGPGENGDGEEDGFVRDDGPGASQVFIPPYKFGEDGEDLGLLLLSDADQEQLLQFGVGVAGKKVDVNMNGPDLYNGVR